MKHKIIPTIFNSNLLVFPFSFQEYKLYYCSYVDGQHSLCVEYSINLSVYSDCVDFDLSFTETKPSGGPFLLTLAFIQNGWICFPIMYAIFIVLLILSINIYFMLPKHVKKSSPDVFSILSLGCLLQSKDSLLR